MNYWRDKAKTGVPRPRPCRLWLLDRFQGYLILGFWRFLPYGKQIHSNRTLSVISVPIFSVFEVGVELKTGVPGFRTYQILA